MPAPPFSLSANAVSYAWGQLLQRAGVSQRNAESGAPVEALELPLHYMSVDRVPEGGPGIVVIPAAPEVWSELIATEPGKLLWAAGRDFFPGQTPAGAEPLPVLFGPAREAAQGGALVERRSDGLVIFHVDILATAFFMLSRWEETVSEVRDYHGRFPAAASVGYRHGFLDRPIVDEYALALREWIRILRPAWRPTETTFSIRLSHDIDSVAMLPTARSRCSALVRSIVQRNYPLNVQEATRALYCDPHLSGIDHLARNSARHGLHSAFYFMAAPVSLRDVGYDPAWAPVRQRARRLAADGFDVGFHPGYFTYDNPERFLAEKQRLERAFDLPLKGGRQHVLRFRVPDTWRLWEAAGFEYESTLGFADQEGFRCGTCHAYQPFDFENDRPFRIFEHPLIAMEVTLRTYRNLTVDQASDRLRFLAERCRRVGGTFTLLWHNTSLSGTWREWGRAYDRLTQSGFARE